MTRKLLIVDDSKLTRRLLQVPLQREGYAVDTAASPNEAIEAVRTSPPDLIITDLKMPTLIDGLGLLEMLAAEAREIPVFIYTADPDPAGTVGKTALARVRFIQKPVDPEILSQEIELVLG